MNNKVVEDFKKNGIAVIPDFLTEEELNDMKRAINKVIDESDVKFEPKMIDGTIEFNMDDHKLKAIDKVNFFLERDAFDEKNNLKYSRRQSIFRIGHNLHCLEPTFKKITFSPKVKKVCQQLGLVEPRVVQGMYIFKNPRIGGVSLPHQDRTFLNVIGKDPKEVGFWIPLEDATTENGCLWYIPGSHKTGLHRQQFVNTSGSGPPLVFDKENPDYDEKSFVPAEVKKGSCVLIDGLVVHKSEPNRSAHARPAYTFHLYDAKSGEWDPKNLFHPTKTNPFPNVYQQ